MIILAIDTSTAYLSVSLLAHDSVYTQTKHIPRQHDKYLITVIDEVLQQANVNKNDITLLAYGVGPGSFVGVRLSASLMQAMSLVLTVPVIGFSNMQAMAVSHYKKTGENGGSMSKLTIEQAKLLKSHLLETTYLHVKEICAYVKKTFGVKYTISGMTKWLKQASFCYKKPQPIPAKVSKEKQEAFLAYYKELKAGLGDGERIYFGDSVHPQHQTRLAYGWIHKSTKKFMPTTARQKRINLIGAITLDNHQVLTMTADKVHTPSMKAFLKKLRAQNPGGKRLHFILDNAAYNKNKELRAFADELNIKLHYLSPYSPNLNPIERLWKIMHEALTYNRYYATFAEFTEAILHFFRHVGKKKRLLRKRITDNFQLWPEHAFAA